MKNVFAKVQGLFSKNTVDMPVREKTDVNQKMAKTVFFILCSVVFIFPLLFVPVLANWFDLVKPTFLVIGVLLAAAVWLLIGGLNKKLDLVRSSFDVPALVFVLIAIISGFLATNRIMNLTSDPLLYVGAFLLFFLIAQNINKDSKLLSFINVILASSAVVAAFSLIQTAANLAKVNIPLLATNFSPTGSYMTQLLLLVAVLPLAIGAYLKTKNTLVGLFLVLIMFGIGTTGFALYKNQPVLLGIETGWKISTGTMGRSLTTAIFGMGPANYVDAFTIYKPADFNVSKYWNLRFTGGANFYFYILSTIGIAGLAAFIWLVSKLFTICQKRLELPSTNALEKGIIGSLAIILVANFFLPAPATQIVLFFTMLGVLVAHFNLTDNPNLARKQQVSLSENAWVAYVPSLLGVALIGVSTFFLGKMLVADYYFGESLKAASANQGTQTYNLQMKAISLNQDNDVYRATYSQTNLALADSLAGQQNLTDQQKSAVIQLVQQAIREGRTAAALNPNRVSNWENLSAIYRSLINFATGADQWTVASINQAIALDPANPQLRLDLGGLYFAARDYTTAAQLFSQAANLKTDYANAHYNLAQALKGLGAKDQAITELQTTASIVCSVGKTTDCDQVNNEISQMGSVAATPAAEVTQLATPAAQVKNLPKAKPVAPVTISSPSGQIQQ